MKNETVWVVIIALALAAMAAYSKSLPQYGTADTMPD